MKTLLTAVLALVLLSGAAIANDKPSLDMDWYGYIKLDGSYDQNLTSHGNFAMWVQQQTQDSDDEQFNMTANQTRVGVKITGKNYNKFDVGGKIEFDLYAGGVAENKAQLQLRHAYLSIGSGNTQVVAGQTWDLVSPLNPSTVNYAVAWGAGNIGYRRPQLTLKQTFPAGQNTKVNVAGGFFRTIGSDLTPSFSLAVGETTEGADDGTDAGIPSFQGLFEVNQQFNNAALRVGVSGLYGEMKAETNLGNSEKYESTLINGHLSFSMNNQWGILGEAWTGSNLLKYNGGALNANLIEGQDAQGGWASAWVKVHPKVKFATGYGFDDPDDATLSTNDRSKNQTIFGNIQYSIVPQAVVGFEVSQWKTDYKDADTAESLRVQTSLQLNF